MENTQTIDTRPAIIIQTLIDIASTVVGAKSENDQEGSGVVLTREAALGILQNVNGLMHFQGNALMIEAAGEDGFVNIYAKPLPAVKTEVEDVVVKGEENA